MEDNPFSAMVMAIRNDIKTQIPVAFRLGTVLSVNPLKLDVAGTVQDSKSLLKNSMANNFIAGDRLLLAPIEEEQRYIIICKVVSV